MSDGRSQQVGPRVSLPEELHALHVGVALFDPETGAILDANSRLVELSGYTVETLRVRTIAEVSANNYAYTQAAAEERIDAAADGEPQSFEWRIKRADGELRWVTVSLSRTTLDGRPYVLGEFTDITEYKHNDRRVSLFHRLLRHNLRNQLNVIMGFASQVATCTDSTPVAAAADAITTAATDLDGISESVKQIEQTITRDGSTCRPRSAATAVDEIAETVDAPDARIAVVEHAEQWIAVDDAFDHALTHAIENAVVHNDHPEPVVEIAVDESPNTGRVEIRITDNGPSIPTMELDALDEHTETTPTSHGSGVGLFVMKWCIESLGGELQIERRDGRGNRVSFYLPPKEPPEAADEQLSAEPIDNQPTVTHTAVDHETATTERVDDYPPR